MLYSLLVAAALAVLPTGPAPIVEKVEVPALHSVTPDMSLARRAGEELKALGIQSVKVLDMPDEQSFIARGFNQDGRVWVMYGRVTEDGYVTELTAIEISRKI